MKRYLFDMTAVKDELTFRVSGYVNTKQDADEVFAAMMTLAEKFGFEVGGGYSEVDNEQKEPESM